MSDCVRAAMQRGRKGGRKGVRQWRGLLFCFLAPPFAVALSVCLSVVLPYLRLPFSPRSARCAAADLRLATAVW